MAGGWRQNEMAGNDAEKPDDRLLTRAARQVRAFVSHSVPSRYGKGVGQSSRFSAASIACAATLFLAPFASAHRLDEYLQATLISIETDRVQVSMRLTPGVAVAGFVLAGIDTNSDGVISDAEGRAYAERVLHDVSLAIDGHLLKPRLISVEIPAVEEMKEGLAEIRIQFSADLPRNGTQRMLVFENHHQGGISAYLVNCLMPSAPEIRVVAQNRNEQQSFYELDYEQAGVSFAPAALKWWQAVPAWPCAAAILVTLRLAFLWRRRAQLPRPS